MDLIIFFVCLVMLPFKNPNHNFNGAGRRYSIPARLSRTVRPPVRNPSLSSDGITISTMDDSVAHNPGDYSFSNNTTGNYFPNEIFYLILISNIFR